jgi:hypothetical protein
VESSRWTTVCRGVLRRQETQVTQEGTDPVRRVHGPSEHCPGKIYKARNFGLGESSGHLAAKRAACRASFPRPTSGTDRGTHGGRSADRTARPSRPCGSGCRTLCTSAPLGCCSWLASGVSKQINGFWGYSCSGALHESSQSKSNPNTAQARASAWRDPRARTCLLARFWVCL